MTNGERAYGDLNDFDTDQTEFFQQYDEKYFSHSSLLGMLREGGLEQMSDLALRVFGLYQMSPRKFWGYDLSEEDQLCLLLGHLLFLPGRLLLQSPQFLLLFQNRILQPAFFCSKLCPILTVFLKPKAAGDANPNSRMLSPR